MFITLLIITMTMIINKKIKALEIEDTLSHNLKSKTTESES